MSRWSNWSRGTKPGKSLQDFLNEGPVDQLRTGNPTGNGSLQPADRAKQLGLQSNGKGGYVDPKTGQIVARTVNNELVFYSTGPTGGAISDGSGGADMSRPSSSWQDPVTGMMITPPGKPETPNELAAIPDAVPAVAPAGYNEFIQRQKQQMYATDFQAREQEKLQAQMPQQPEMAPETDPGAMMQPADPAMSMENYQPGQLMGRLKTAHERQTELQGGKPNPEANAQEIIKNLGVAQPHQQAAFDNRQQAPQPQQSTPNPTTEPSSEPTPEQNEDERKQNLIGVLGRLVATPDRMRGAGAYALSRDDANAFIKYIQEGPQNKRVPLGEGELDFAISYLKEKYKDKWGSIQNRLKGKGDPEPARKVVARSREVLESYLENLGTSAIDGSDLPFSESELDHMMSLDNGGMDEKDNWAWLPRRFNQFKGALDDDTLLGKLQERLANNPEDEELKEKTQALQRRQRGDWKQYFTDKGWSQLSQGDINAQSGPLGGQFLKALAEASGTSYYKDRGVTRSSGRAGGGTALGIDELKQRLIDNLEIPSQQDVDAFDQDLVDILQSLEDQRSDVDSANRARKKARKSAKSLKKEDYETFEMFLDYMRNK